MRETEAEGVEAKAVDRREVVLVAVHGVVDHRVLQVAQVDANLVAAAGVEFKFHQAVTARGLLHLIMRHRQLPSVVDWRRKDAKLAIGEPTFHFAVCRLYVSPGHSNIAAIEDHALPILFEFLRDFLTLADHH